MITLFCTQKYRENIQIKTINMVDVTSVTIPSTIDIVPETYETFDGCYEIVDWLKENLDVSEYEIEASNYDFGRQYVVKFHIKSKEAVTAFKLRWI